MICRERGSAVLGEEAAGEPQLPRKNSPAGPAPDGRSARRRLGLVIMCRDGPRCNGAAGANDERRRSYVE